MTEVGMKFFQADLLGFVGTGRVVLEDEDNDIGFKTLRLSCFLDEFIIDNSP